jgi:hypothetical protein
MCFWGVNMHPSVWQDEDQAKPYIAYWEPWKNNLSIAPITNFNSYLLANFTALMYEPATNGSSTYQLAVYQPYPFFSATARDLNKLENRGFLVKWRGESKVKENLMILLSLIMFKVVDDSIKRDCFKLFIKFWRGQEKKLILLRLLFILKFVIVIFSAPLFRNRDNSRTGQLTGEFTETKPVTSRAEICRIFFLFGSESFLL